MGTVTSADDQQQRTRLADVVRARRTELRTSVRAAAKQAGIARDTWIGLEEATRRTAEINYAGIEDTLQWARGSIQLILDGGEPVPVTADEAAATAARHPATGTAQPGDAALIRIMRSPDLSDDQKARIVRALIADQERYAEQRADELIAQARGED